MLFFPLNLLLSVKGQQEFQEFLAPSRPELTQNQASITSLQELREAQLEFEKSKAELQVLVDSPKKTLGNMSHDKDLVYLRSCTKNQPYQWWTNQDIMEW